MTPGARCAAAITVLEAVLAGRPAEVALVNWGRANRYAGSGDRAAVRDIVFDVLRCRRSCAALGGGMTARGLVLGWARAQGREALFDGQGHAPCRRGRRIRGACRKGRRRWIARIGWSGLCGSRWAKLLPR